MQGTLYTPVEWGIKSTKLSRLPCSQALTNRLVRVGMDIAFLFSVQASISKIIRTHSDF